MGRNQKYPWFLQWLVIIIKSLMKLYEFNHKSVVRTSNNPFLFHKGLSFFVIIPVFEDNISNNQSNRSRNTLNAMYQNILFIFVCILNEINNSIKETLYVFVLRVFEEKRKIGKTFWFKPILTVIACTIDDMLDVVLLESVKVFGNFLAWYIKSFNYLTAFFFAFLSFTSSLFRSVCHAWTHLQTLIWSFSFSSFLSS